MRPAGIMTAGTTLHRSSLAGCDSRDNRRIGRVVAGVAGVVITQTARNVDIDRIRRTVTNRTVRQVLEGMGMIAMREDLIRVTRSTEDLGRRRIDRVADQGVVARCLMTDSTVPAAHRHMLGDGIGIMTGVATSVGGAIAITITKGNLAVSRIADRMRIAYAVTRFTVVVASNDRTIGGRAGLQGWRSAVTVGAGILMNRNHCLWIVDRIIFMTDYTVGRLQEDGVWITVTTMLRHIIVAMTGDAGRDAGAGTLTVGNGVIDRCLQRQALRVRHGSGVIVMTKVTAVAIAVVEGIDIGLGN